MQPATNIFAQHARPFRYVVIDIETGYPPQDAIDAALQNWKAPKNWKPETVEAKRSEAEKNIREKSALLDSAPILCICAKSEAQSIAFNGMSAEQYSINDWFTIGCGDERTMLIGLREWLDSFTDETTAIVGHNHKSFDVPKLRGRYAHHRLRLPQALMYRAVELIDTMQLAKHFSVEHNNDFMVSLDDVCFMLDVERPKQHFSGAEVPDAHKRGEYELILNYCAIDCVATEQCFQIMAGQHPNQE